MIAWLKSSGAAESVLPNVAAASAMTSGVADEHALSSKRLALMYRMVRSFRIMIDALSQPIVEDFWDPAHHTLKFLGGG